MHMVLHRFHCSAFDICYFKRLLGDGAMNKNIIIKGRKPKRSIVQYVLHIAFVIYFAVAYDGDTMVKMVQRMPFLWQLAFVKKKMFICNNRNSEI